MEKQESGSGRIHSQRNKERTTRPRPTHANHANTNLLRVHAAQLGRDPLPADGALLHQRIVRVGRAQALQQRCANTKETVSARPPIS